MILPIRLNTKLLKRVEYWLVGSSSLVGLVVYLDTLSELRVLDEVRLIWVEAE